MPQAELETRSRISALRTFHYVFARAITRRVMATLLFESCLLAQQVMVVLREAVGFVADVLKQA